MARRSRLYKSVLKLGGVSNDPSCAVTTSTLGASPDNDVFPQGKNARVGFIVLDSLFIFIISFVCAIFFSPFSNVFVYGIHVV